MLLGNINYLVQKMSSTVVSSLMTGVPIIADSQVLASYTFLKPEHVFLIGAHETEMDVMQRVSLHIIMIVDDGLHLQHCIPWAQGLCAAAGPLVGASANLIY
jgi:hypothetical protein